VREDSEISRTVGRDGRLGPESVMLMRLALSLNVLADKCEEVQIPKEEMERC